MTQLNCDCDPAVGKI